MVTALLHHLRQENLSINRDILTGDISNSNSLNRYTYVEGNPATMIDPFGLCAECAEKALYGAVLLGSLIELDFGI